MILQLFELENEDVGTVTFDSSANTEDQIPIDQQGTATTIAAQPRTVNFDVVFGDSAGQWRAAEIEQLLNAPPASPFVIDSDVIDDLSGYYAPVSSSRDARLTQSKANEDYHRTSVSVTEVGTKASHFRALRTNPHLVDHEFGNDLDATIGLPVEARKTRWFHPDSKQTEPAEPIDTLPTKRGDVDLYDIEDASWYAVDEGDTPPALIYELDYAAEVDSGAFVFDTRGTDSQFDDGGIRQWQAVLLPSHDVDDTIVLDNGLIRLWLDEQAATIEADWWDPGARSAVEDSGLYGEGLYGEGLPAGFNEPAWQPFEIDQPDDVDLYDIDIQEIGLVRDSVQLTFDVDGDLYALDVTLATGDDAALISVPDGEDGPIPGPLTAWLTPIASESEVDVNEHKGLVDRSQVRR